MIPIRPHQVHSVSGVLDADFFFAHRIAIAVAIHAKFKIAHPPMAVA